MPAGLGITQPHPLTLHMYLPTQTVEESLLSTSGTINPSHKGHHRVIEHGYTDTHSWFKYKAGVQHPISTFKWISEDN